MANDIGYIRPEDIIQFKAWLDTRGIGWNPGIGLWEVMRVSYGAFNCIITRNKVSHYKSPVELRPLLLEFRDYMRTLETKTETSEVITDSQRLDFMLEKSRKLVYEVIGYNGRGQSFIDVYVEQGFMSERRFGAVHIEVQNLSEDCTPQTKRAAIDLAITEIRSESSV